jgi:hypothetical protein
MDNNSAPEEFQNNNPMRTTDDVLVPEHYERFIQGFEESIVLTVDQAKVINNYFGGLLIP